jgi:hypothetical protein
VPPSGPVLGRRVMTMASRTPRSNASEGESSNSPRMSDSKRELAERIRQLLQ